MPKLLNGRSMDELVCDGREILVMDIHGHSAICWATNSLKEDMGYSEWMEIIRPDPKPDANGWYKSSEIQPDQEGKSVLTINSKTKMNYLIVRWNEVNQVHPDTYSHWRYIDLPVEI